MSVSPTVTPDRPRPALSSSALRTFRTADLRLPSYNRNLLQPSVVHLGLGGFHRSHQAAYFDDLAESGNLDWGIVAASSRSRQAVDALRAQRGLYTLVQRDSDGESARVVGSLTRCLFGPDDPWSLIRVLADERTRLVTLTITGDGYKVPRPARRGFNGQVDDRPAPWDYLALALGERRRQGRGVFTVLSCDNIPQSGEAARQALISTAEAYDEVLARWIARSVSFPDSMVDRITPPAKPAEAAYVQDRFGMYDRCPVVAESFAQWIVEDDFSHERPPLEDFGVRFVSDVRPYGLMKNRLLNGGHSALGYLGVLAGHRWTDQALRDPLIRRYLTGLMAQEIAPLLPAVPGIDLAGYQRTLISRFSNSAVRDPLSRLCGRGSTKVPSYLLPSLHEARAEDRPHGLLTLALAGWLRCLRGTDLSGRELSLRDARAEELQALAREGQNDPRPLLSQREIFGTLIDDEAMVSDLRQALEDLERCGVHGAISSRVAGAMTIGA